jgi:hypothetical protein
MTKHRTITGFAAVALLAAFATVATMRSNSPSNSIVAAGLSFKDLNVDVSKLPNDDYDDQSLVFSKKR